jgi:hypothetical protein
MATINPMSTSMLKQFNGTNFVTWEYRLRLLLEQNEALEVLDEA